MDCRACIVVFGLSFITILIHFVANIILAFIDFFVEEALCIKSWVEKKRAVAEVMTDK